MTLRELFQTVDLEAPAALAQRPISGIVCDSRQVRPGAVFVALKGTTHDGSVFVEDAVARGAVIVLAEQTIRVRGDAAVVVVDDARARFAELSAAFHAFPSVHLRVCGVTGTNGKTTVTFMVRDMLRAAGEQPGMIGTVQYEIGARAIPALRTTPDAGELQTLLAQMRQVGCKSVAMEVSSHAVDQKRVWSVAFDVGVFTNLTRDHLDYHGDMDSYYQAKRAFFMRLGWDGRPATAVLNIDDAYGQRLAEDPALAIPVLHYGVDTRAVVRATDVESRLSGSRFYIDSPWGRHRIRLRLLGDYNVSNALAAFAAGGAMGLDPAVMVAALEAMRTIPGRLEEVNGASGFRVFVDYAHTDDALENVLKTLRPLTPGRLIVVFGCGGNRDRTKREAMGAAVSRGADIAVVTTDNPRKEDPEAIIREVLAGFPSDGAPLVAIDREDAIRMALSIAAEGDVVLIAGKGHESFQEFAHTVIPFDDREIARELLRARRAAVRAGHSP